jgi:hypothetical protein
MSPARARDAASHRLGWILGLGFVRVVRVVLLVGLLGVRTFAAMMMVMRVMMCGG